MLKKLIRSILLCLVLLQPSLQADNWFQSSCCDQSCCMGDITLEGRFSAFFPLKSRAREIYNDALPCLELQVATTLCDCWQPWFNASYIWSNGHSSLGDKTQLSILPLSLGVNYIFPLCDCIDWYIGAGALYSFLRTEDHSPYVHEHVRKNTWGGTAKLGFYYQWTECLFLEGFLDYVYQKFNFKTDEDSVPFVVRNDVDLSALKLGVGLGFRF